MSLTLNMVGGGSGGGISPNEAVIHVTAPIGSTIAFEKGGVTVKVLDASKSHVNAADSTMADWYFSVSSNNYGVWTVTAANSSSNQSKDVEITSNKKYNVFVNVRKYLIRDGVTDSSVVGSWKKKPWQFDGDSTTRTATPAVTNQNGFMRVTVANGGGGIYSANRIDLNNFNTIVTDAVSYGQWGGNLFTHWAMNGAYAVTNAATRNGISNVHRTIFRGDISSVNSVLYVGAFFSNASGTTGNDIYNMYLES